MSDRGFFSKHCDSVAARTAEVRGLRLLREAIERDPEASKLLSVPVVYDNPTDSETASSSSTGTKITMTQVQQGDGRLSAAEKADAYRRMGQGLARMHLSTWRRHDAGEGQQQPPSAFPEGHLPDGRDAVASSSSGAATTVLLFGDAADGFIGMGLQRNTLCGSWGQFFVEHRLRAKVNEIKDPALRRGYTRRIDEMAEEAVAFLDSVCDGSCLVHGDLWGGNAMVDDSGRPWIIDPAAYYGDREVDLAMTTMFGGFPASFYDGYDSVFPRTAAYEVKKTIYNLYHYLNHLVLFGHGYVQGCGEGFTALQDAAKPLPKEEYDEEEEEEEASKSRWPGENDTWE